MAPAFRPAPALPERRRTALLPPGKKTTLTQRQEAAGPAGTNQAGPGSGGRRRPLLLPAGEGGRAGPARPGGARGRWRRAAPPAAGTRPPPQAGRQVTWGGGERRCGPALWQGLLSGSPCAGRGRDSPRPEPGLNPASPPPPPLLSSPSPLLSSPLPAPLRSLSSAGRNLKEWLREQFCDHPIEHCEDTRLHDAAYVGDLPTLKSLLQEESFQR